MIPIDETGAEMSEADKLFSGSCGPPTPERETSAAIL
jgi:hypothetical protein